MVSIFKKYFTDIDVLILLLAVLFQLLEVKVFQIKPIEILGLLSLGWSINSLARFEKQLIYFFTIFLAISVIHNLWLPFIEQLHTFPKQPYLISLVRYIESLSCVGIVVYVRRFLITKVGVEYFVNKFIAFSVLFNGLLILIWLMDYFQFLDSSLTYFNRERFRLRGFFYEGGPLGMYNAFLLILSNIFIKNKVKYTYFLIFAIIIVLSLSKAGVIGILLYLGLLVINKVYQSKVKIGFKLTVGMIALIPLLYLGYKVFSVYTDTLFNYDYLISIAKEDPNHYWINGGRVPGFYIVKEMFRHHPIIGIGMGNYQLLRDSAVFRSGFPSTTLWDYHGFGGAVDLFLEFGILGVLCFMLVLILNINKSDYSLILLFVLPFMLGTSIYFCYPWIVLSLFSQMDIGCKVSSWKLTLTK